MSWDTGTGGDAWDPSATAVDSGTEADTWGRGADTNTGGAADSWGGGSDDNAAGGGDSGNKACRGCGEVGHFARECPTNPSGGMTGECYKCGQVGHNKADCTNPRVERPFSGTCNGCGEEGHAMRDCPKATCKLCNEPGHKALDCKSRRVVDWTGVPELDATTAWEKLIEAAKVKDLDVFKTCLRSYARATMEEFNLAAVEQALREDDMGVYLIAREQEISKDRVIVDLIGNPDRKFILSCQFSEKPRRQKFNQGWPENPVQNLERLESAGFVVDRGVPLCGNCGELGHIRKHCKEEQIESHRPVHVVTCANCNEEGHRARDCMKERVNPFACRNCKQEGHTSKECPEPRSAENVECRKCNEMGHFSKDCPNVEARPPRTCRNCGSCDHMAKECDQPKNPDNIQCRNCEKMGHFSRDCPEPKDWSKVKCSNCGEMGHTIKRCKEPIAEGDAMGDGGAVGDSSGWSTAADASAAAPVEAIGGWDSGAGGGGW